MTRPGIEPATPGHKADALPLSHCAGLAEAVLTSTDNLYFWAEIFLLENIDCGYSLEPPRRGGSNEYHNLCFLRGGSNEYPRSMFLSRNMKNIRIFYPKNYQFLVVKFSVYLNRRVFVMSAFPYQFHIRPQMKSSFFFFYCIVSSFCFFSVPWFSSFWLNSSKYLGPLMDFGEQGSKAICFRGTREKV